MNKKAIGITGEDLYTEYCLRTKNKLKIIKKIIWKDNEAMYKKPTLCLIGQKNKRINNKIKIGITTKYKKIADKYLLTLDKKYKIEKLYFNGSTELSCKEGITDLVIDIVNTGSTIKKLKLKVYDKILQSDLLVIGTE